MGAPLRAVSYPPVLPLMHPALRGLCKPSLVGLTAGILDCFSFFFFFFFFFFFWSIDLVIHFSRSGSCIGCIDVESIPTAAAAASWTYDVTRRRTTTTTIQWARGQLESSSSTSSAASTAKKTDQWRFCMSWIVFIFFRVISRFSRSFVNCRFPRIVPQVQDHNAAATTSTSTDLQRRFRRNWFTRWPRRIGQRCHNWSVRSLHGCGGGGGSSSGLVPSSSFFASV